MWWQLVKSTTSWSLRVGCGVHVVHSFVYEVSDTHGESMLPTLNFVGDFVHVNKYYRRGRQCQVGDLVVATKPTDPEQRVSKRITGMPGDVLLRDPSSGDYDQFIVVPQGHCWLTGDNLSQSLDSRSYGPVPLAMIKGKVIAAHNAQWTSFWNPFTWKFEFRRLGNNLERTQSGNPE